MFYRVCNAERENPASMRAAAALKWQQGLRSPDAYQIAMVPAKLT